MRGWIWGRIVTWNLQWIECFDTKPWKLNCVQLSFSFSEIQLISWSLQFPFQCRRIPTKVPPSTAMLLIIDPGFAFSLLHSSQRILHQLNLQQLQRVTEFCTNWICDNCREGLSTRPVASSDEIQLHIDPGIDFDDEITGLRGQVRKLKNVFHCLSISLFRFSLFWFVTWIKSSYVSAAGCWRYRFGGQVSERFSGTSGMWFCGFGYFLLVSNFGWRKESACWGPRPQTCLLYDSGNNGILYALDVLNSTDFENVKC